MKSLLRQSEFCRAIVRAAREIPSDLRKLRAVRRRRPLIEQYLATSSSRKLQIGAGPNALEGWLNADFQPQNPSIIFMDATRPFPLPDSSIDLIFSEHMIEHVAFDQGLRMLRECFRVLRRGGRIRIATPNLARVTALETETPSDSQRRYVEWAIRNHVSYALSNGATNYRPAYVINNFFWGFGHYFVYDPETLAAALGSCGFVNITQFEPGESDVTELRGLERHSHLIGQEYNEFETMVLQAQKS